jgi:hypothetical protein
VERGREVLKQVDIMRWQYIFLMIIAGMEILVALLWPLCVHIVDIIPPAGLRLSMSVTGVITLSIMLFLRIYDVSQRRYLASVLAGTIILSLCFYCWQYNILEQYRFEKRFVISAKKLAGDIESYSFAIPKPSASIVYYLAFQGPVTVLSDMDDVREFLEADGVRYLMLRRRSLEKERFSTIPPSVLEHPVMVSPTTGHRRRHMQLMLWRFTSPVDWSVH